MRREQKRTNAQLARLKLRLQDAITHNGIQIDNSLHDDLKQIAIESESEHGPVAHANSFQRLFWEQQKKAAALKNSCSMRWYPLFKVVFVPKTSVKQSL